VLRYGLARGIRAASTGKVERHRGPEANPTLDQDMAPQLLDEAEDLREAEAGALANFLGCEEWFEDMGDDILVHADPRVADLDEPVLAGDQIIAVAVRPGFGDQRCRRPDRKGSSLRHGVTRIDGEIEEGVLELIGISKDMPAAAAEGGLDDYSTVQRPTKQIRHAGNEVIEVYRPTNERLTACEGKQAIRQRCGALRGVQGRTDELHALGARDGTALQLFEVAENDRQQIVEIVRHAASELPDRFHFLRLPKLGLDPMAFRRVVDECDCADDPALSVPQRRERLVVVTLTPGLWKSIMLIGDGRRPPR